jgi:plasmid maintenance system killer protein
MIRNFADKATERLFRDGVCPARWRNIEAVGLRKLDMVDAATRPDDLLFPSGQPAGDFERESSRAAFHSYQPAMARLFPLDSGWSRGGRDCGLSLGR